jgi:hypothetical protein
VAFRRATTVNTKVPASAAHAEEWEQTTARHFPIQLPVERHMRQISFIASILIFHLRRAATALATFLHPFRDVRKYRPERHYMRGPGPKWREKHFDRRASSARGT